MRMQWVHPRVLGGISHNMRWLSICSALILGLGGSASAANAQHYADPSGDEEDWSADLDEEEGEAWSGEDEEGDDDEEGEDGDDDDEGGDDEGGDDEGGDDEGGDDDDGDGEEGDESPAGPVVGTMPAMSAPPTSGTAGWSTAGPWVSWYGGAGDLEQTAQRFRIINIDADPDSDNFTDAELQTLRANGRNRVLSYLNVGSCERFRSYYANKPAGHESCESSGALTTPYDGYEDEKWANLSNHAYQDLIVNHVAARLAARNVDGFYLDNLEVVEHGASTDNGPCDSACSAGGLELVWQLRQKFPDKLIVMQNATSDVTRLGVTHGVAFPSLLSGVAHEEVYSHGGDSDALDEMIAWRDMRLMAGSQPFWLAVEEYVGECSASNKSQADAIYEAAAADGFSAYVTDASAAQSAPCFW